MMQIEEVDEIHEHGHERPPAPSDSDALGHTHPHEHPDGTVHSHRHRHTQPTPTRDANGTIDATNPDPFEVDVPTADGETQRYCVEASSAEYVIIKLLEQIAPAVAEIRDLLRVIDLRQVDNEDERNANYHGWHKEHD